MAVPTIIFQADGVFVISVQTEGGTQRDRARAQVRQALSDVLSRLLQLPADAISVQSAPSQAPRIVIDGARQIGCSFSHESGLSLAAVNLHGTVGVDILRIAGIPDWQAVSRDYLGPDVTAALLALPAQDRPRAFAQAWTGNEARLKCAGRQLAEWRPATNDASSVRTMVLELPGDLAGTLATSA